MVLTKWIQMFPVIKQEVLNDENEIAQENSKQKCQWENKIHWLLYTDEGY